MKATKDGKLKLSKNERQIGNFVWKNEPEYIKVCDINSAITHRISKQLNVGKMFEMALNEKNDTSLSLYAAILWLFSNIVPDPQWAQDIDKACADCINRHKAFYGIKEDLTEEEDKEILEEVKEVQELLQEEK